MLRRVITFLGLEAFAIFLALAQFHVGVRTDEAKYLLNIPYPHPPLARWILGLTEWIPFQELFWRIVFSSLLIQAGWFLLQFSKNQEPIKFGSYLVLGSSDLLVVSTWLFSSAVLLQAGTVMMVSLTVAQALLFLWLRRRHDLVRRFPGFVALLWLASLFTAYQAILFAPVVLFLFFTTQPRWRAAAYTFLPIALVTLYILTNPLALASFVIHGSREAAQTLSQTFTATLHLWIVGGSLIGSILGTLGIFLSRRLDLIGSLALVFLYILVGQHEYYALLFAPLFVAGVIEKSSKGRVFAYCSSIFTIVCAIYLVSYSFPSVPSSSARGVLRMIRMSGGEGRGILISGSFGHEWQYESRVPVSRYRFASLVDASAAICLQPCPGIESAPGWERLPHAPVEAWIRR